MRTRPLSSRPALQPGGADPLGARYATLLRAAGVFLVINTLVRLGLLVIAGDLSHWLPTRLLRVPGVGFCRCWA